MQENSYCGQTYNCQIWFPAEFCSVFLFNLFTISSPLLRQLQKYSIVNNLGQKIFVRFVSIFRCHVRVGITEVSVEDKVGRVGIFWLL